MIMAVLVEYMISHFHVVFSWKNRPSSNSSKYRLHYTASGVEFYVFPVELYEET